MYRISWILVWLPFFLAQTGYSQDRISISFEPGFYAWNNTHGFSEEISIRLTHGASLSMDFQWRDQSFTVAAGYRRGSARNEYEPGSFPYASEELHHLYIPAGLFLNRDLFHSLRISAGINMAVHYGQKIASVQHSYTSYMMDETVSFGAGLSGTIQKDLFVLFGGRSIIAAALSTQWTEYFLSNSRKDNGNSGFRYFLIKPGVSLSLTL